MKKRLIRMLALVCLVCIFMCACDSKEEITADQAVSIMMEDLGAEAGSVGEPHIHTGTFDNKDVYNIYISVSGESWVYIISADGEIIAKAPAEHSH